MNKCRTRLIFLFCISFVDAFPQTEIQRPAIAIHFFFDHFTRDEQMHLPGHTEKFTPGLAISYMKGLSPRLDLFASMSASFPRGKSDSSRSLLLEAAALAKINLLTGKHVLVPVFEAGAGFSVRDRRYRILLPAGLGLRANLPGETFLLLDAQYRFTPTDMTASHFYYAAGIAGIIGRKRMKGPGSKPLPPVPLESPALSAPADSDGDGIPDSLDACPSIPGSMAFKGCPPPPPPPPVPVSAPPPDIRQKLDLAAKNIFFKTDSHILTTGSYKALDEVIVLLKTDNSLRLTVEGHTDNTGDTTHNLLLSRQRAGSVMNYLVSHGHIEPGRLTAAGFGCSRPIASNSTEEGRALNRRVEFLPGY